MTRKPMTVTSRNVTIRDFAIFQIKLALDGLKDLVAFNLSIVALILDFISGRGKRPRLFYSVVRGSERFDKWLNLHSVINQMDESGTDDGFFGGAAADDDSLVGEIERLVKRGKDKAGLGAPPASEARSDGTLDPRDSTTPE